MNVSFTQTSIHHYPLEVNSYFLKIFKKIMLNLLKAEINYLENNQGVEANSLDSNQLFSFDWIPLFAVP